MPKQKKKKNVSDLFEQEKAGCALDSVTSNRICGHHFQESRVLSMRMSAGEQLFPGPQTVSEPLWNEHRKIKIRVICSGWNKASHLRRSR